MNDEPSLLGQKKYVLVAGALAGTIGLLLLRNFDPATSGIFPPCPLHFLTGWYCPGCGSLRALHQLLRGNLRAAWALNPLTMVLLPFIGYGLMSQLWLVLRGRGLPGVFLSANAIRALCGAIVLFGILRNLPVHPFNLLAPGATLHW
ncbi:MAG TPA: DUF2752 domain-containing protein [Candidatus Acidoferrales bacterium]|nr:DUF2752 domain-containing protein [Candidatus Acidoferrales bacterium]